MITIKFVKQCQQKFLLAFVYLCASTSVSALEWTKSFYLPTSIDYDSNILMSSDDEKEVMRFIVAPRVNINGADDLNSYSFNGILSVARSSDEAISVDRNDPTIDAGWVRSFERGQFSLLANYQKSSIRASELNRSGIVFADESSINRTINANVNYMLSEKFTLGTGVGYQKQTFTGDGLSSFDNKMFNVQLAHQYSEKLSPFYRFSMSRFTEDESGRSSVSKNFLTGANYSVNPKLSFMTSLGVNNVSSAGSGWIGESELNYAVTENSLLIASLARSVSAGGLGGFQKSDALSMAYTRDLTSKDHIGTNYSWTINRTINDSRFMQISGWYARDISQDWSLRINAQMRNLKSSVQDADASLVGISIIYNQLNF